MKINAIDQLSLKMINLKNGNEPQNPQEPVSASKPEMIMNALNLQGMNNITFQGVKERVAQNGVKVAHDTFNSDALKKLLLAAPVAIATVFGTTSTTSCSPEFLREVYGDNDTTITNITISVENTCNHDNSAIIAWLEKLYSQNQISAEQRAVYEAAMLELVQAALNGQITTNEYLAQLVALKKEMITLVAANNANGQKILARLEDIEDLLANKLISPEAYQKMIDDLWNKLSGALDGISDGILKLIELAKLSYEQHLISSQQANDIKATLGAFYNEYVAGKTTQEEMLNNIFNYMVLNDERQKLILEQLKANGKTEAEAKAYLEKILAEVQDGKLSAAEAMGKILAELGDINVSLDNIEMILKNISEQINKNHEDYMKAKDELFTGMSSLIKQGEVDTEILHNLLGNHEKTNSLLDSEVKNTNAIIEILKDDTKYNEFKELISNLEPESIDYSKFEEMFNVYGLSMSEAIKMSADQLEAALKTYMEQDLAMDKEHSALLGEILANFGYLASRPGTDMSGVEAAIKALQDAYQTGNKDILGALNGIQNKLDEIDATIDKMYDSLGALSNAVTTYHELYMENWNSTLELLASGNGTLKSIKDEQNATNKKMDALNGKIDGLDKSLQELLDKGYGEFPMAEFIQYMDGYGDQNIKNLRALFIELGMDQIDENTATLAEYKTLLQQIKSGINANGARLDAILAKLEAMVLTPEQIKEILLEVAEQHKCNCNCSGGSHEGILDDFENKVDGLV